jgi:hypothetical protein
MPTGRLKGDNHAKQVKSKKNLAFASLSILFRLLVSCHPFACLSADRGWGNQTRGYTLFIKTTVWSFAYPRARQE